MGTENLSPPLPPDVAPKAPKDNRPTLYNFLRQQGMSDEWIERELRNILTEAGFTYSEINAYFARHKLPEAYDNWSGRGDLNPTADPARNAELAEEARLKTGAGEYASLENLTEQGISSSLAGSAVYEGVQNAQGNYLTVPRAFGPEVGRLVGNAQSARQGEQLDDSAQFKALPAPGSGPAETQTGDPMFRWLDEDGAFHSGSFTPPRLEAYQQRINSNPQMSRAAQAFLSMVSQYHEQFAQDAAGARSVPDSAPPVRQFDPNFMPRAFGGYGIELQSEVEKAKLEKQTFDETKVPEFGLTQAEMHSLPFIKRMVVNLVAMGMDLPIYTLGAMFTPAMPVLGGMGLTGAIRGAYNYYDEHGRPQDFFEIMDMCGAIAGGAIKGAASGWLGSKAGVFGGRYIANIDGSRAARFVGAGAAEGITLTAAEAILYGQLPTRQNYIDSVFTILLMKGAAPALAHGRQGLNKSVQFMENKLRDIYVYTGILPQKVAADAAADPVLYQELLNEQVLVPNKYAEQAKQSLSRRAGAPPGELESSQDLERARTALVEGVRWRKSAAEVGQAYERLAGVAEDFAPAPQGDGESAGRDQVK